MIIILTVISAIIVSSIIFVDYSCIYDYCIIIFFDNCHSAMYSFNCYIIVGLLLNFC